MGDRFHQSCLDTNVSSSICRTHLGKPLYATVDSQAQFKVNKHAANCRANGYGFVALALDVCGLLSHSTSRFLSRCAVAASARLGTSPALQLSFFRRRVSLALQMGVGSQLAGLSLSHVDVG
jgi:hypothetical protein